jgi:hypothetical protein
MKKLLTQWVLIGGLVLTCLPTFALEPGFSPVPIAVGARREQIRSTHILHRPYRPGHFYGNTVRRRYYHGTAVPGVGAVQQVRPRGVR